MARSCNTKERKIKTTEHCKDCGWCCYYSNHPVPTNDYFTLERMLELYYMQGHKVYWEPGNGKWYVLHVAPCAQYNTKTKLCKLYETGKRPEICKDYVCPDPGNMWERHEKLCAESQRYLKRKFGER